MKEDIASVQSGSVGVRLLAALAGALVSGTVAWIFWGLVTPGDYFANGNVVALPSIVIFAVGGLVGGFRASRRYRLIFFVLALAAVCFWLFVPTGWWSHGLPGR